MKNRIARVFATSLVLALVADGLVAAVAPRRDGLARRAVGFAGSLRHGERQRPGVMFDV